MRKPGDYDRLQGCTHLAVLLVAVNSPTLCKNSDTRALSPLLPTYLVSKAGFLVENAREQPSVDRADFVLTAWSHTPQNQAAERGLVG
mgnify:FL=1|jgi:hypothetical protein